MKIKNSESGGKVKVSEEKIGGSPYPGQVLRGVHKKIKEFKDKEKEVTALRKL